MHQGGIINDLEGLFPEICSLTIPIIRHKRGVSVTIVCIPFSTRLEGLSLLPNFQKGVLDEISIFNGQGRVVCKEGSDLCDCT